MADVMRVDSSMSVNMIVMRSPAGAAAAGDDGVEEAIGGEASEEALRKSLPPGGKN